jgi:hypothetical protein
MTRQDEFIRAARRRALELMLEDDTLDLLTAEQLAVKELKTVKGGVTKQTRSPPSKRKPSGARARLGAMLSNIASRMSAAAALPRALPATTGVVRTAGAAIPGASVSTQPPVLAEPSSSGVLGVFAGNSPTGATRIDHEFPVHPAVANWHASLERNRRGGSSS